MALYQLHFHSPSASFNFSLSSKPKKPHLKRNFHQNRVREGVIYASSSEKPRKKKGRPSKAAMSDEDLCKELREVILVAGLPAVRVPLMKELCEHGRKDLANIVRRRGYKVVSMLLSTSDLSDNHRENSFVEYQERSDPHGDESSEFEDAHLGSAESIPSLRKCYVVEDYTAETNGTVQNDMPVQIGEPSRSSIGPIASFSYQKSESDINVYGTSRWVHALKEDQLPGSDRIINQAKSIETNEVFAEDNSKTEINHLKALLHQKEMELVELKQHIEKEKVFAEDNSKTEINHLKALLHQNEMELVELKQHIEKEKQALTLLQARVQNEIVKVHRVILTKDAELRASTDKLSGLKEVQVQFCVNGETVEVAGSFNGWHKQIKMNLHPSSSTVDLQGSRVSKLWSTILWLYPGTYEIKFIVDGQWMIDPQREFVTHGHLTNNVLRVDSSKPFQFVSILFIMIHGSRSESKASAD